MQHVHYRAQHSSECGYLSRFAKLSGFIAATSTAKVKTFAMLQKQAEKFVIKGWARMLEQTFFPGNSLLHKYGKTKNNVLTALSKPRRKKD